jgi:hypothetical protein
VEENISCLKNEKFSFLSASSKVAAALAKLNISTPATTLAGATTAADLTATPGPPTPSGPVAVFF